MQAGGRLGGLILASALAAGGPLAAGALAAGALAACGPAAPRPSPAATAERAPAAGRAGSGTRSGSGSGSVTEARTETGATQGEAGESEASGGAAPVAADWRAAYAERAAVQTLRGQVSYYHDSLAGRSTASGEPYDPRAYTAASRDLPFGTVIRVVREDTGASTIVRVNDRGPFGRRRRLLDLSRAAAEELGMIERGVAGVRAEIVELGPRRRRRP